MVFKGFRAGQGKLLETLVSEKNTPWRQGTLNNKVYKGLSARLDSCLEAYSLGAYSLVAYSLGA